MLHGSGLARHFLEIPFWWSPLKRKPATTATLLVLTVSLVAAFTSSSWIDNQQQKPDTNLSNKLPRTFQTEELDRSPNPVCPDYFRWIHEDLRPWKTSEITRDMVERANKTETFILVIIRGKAYVENYRKAIQTRDVSPSGASCNFSGSTPEGYRTWKSCLTLKVDRYKIYIEGYTWSVSEKYILACDSVTFIVQPQFYDFFVRSMRHVEHYWPIRDDDKYRSLMFAVDWGNNHKKKAQEIGKAASSFMQDQLKMDYIYDYMYHLLNEYAKLLKFEPRIAEGAVELCSEVMACQQKDLKGGRRIS
ncbi:hypothetical protein CRYUN_Cryun12cG0044300 [Craigia yunnanensis]